MCKLTRIYVLTYAHSRSLSRGPEIAQFWVATLLVVTPTGKKCQNSRNCPHHRQTGGELPAFLALPLRGLTLASNEIPVGGQAVALIDVIMRNAAFVEKFIELRKSSEIIQQLTTIHFRDGPDGGLGQRYEDILTKMSS
jgi:hypothetical protein